MNLSHFKGSIIILRIFSPLLFPSFLGRSSIGLFPFLSLKASAPVHLMGEALRAIIAQQFPRPWNCCSFQITWISLHQHHLCLPACANLQFKSLHCAFFFFPKEKQEIPVTIPCRKQQEKRDSKSFPQTQHKESCFPENFSFLFFWQKREKTPH